LRVLAWVGSILVFHSERKRGLKLINILPTHVETHNGKEGETIDREMVATNIHS
jgi:hypothetical protein